MSQSLDEKMTFFKEEARRKRHVADAHLAELKTILLQSSIPENNHMPLILYRVVCEYDPLTREAAAAAVRNARSKAAAEGRPFAERAEIDRAIREVLADRRQLVLQKLAAIKESVQRTSENGSRNTPRPPDRWKRIMDRRTDDERRLSDSRLFDLYRDTIPPDTLVLQTSAGELKSRDTTLIAEFLKIGERELSRRCNELQFKKLYLLKQKLAKQKEGHTEQVTTVIDQKLSLLASLETQFAQWFLDQGYDIPDKSALQENRELKTTSQKPSEYPIEGMATKYVEFVKLRDIDSPSQLQLSEVTGISQSTWSRTFKKRDFWERVSVLLDDQMERSKRERDKQDTGFERILHARRVADDHAQKLTNRYRSGKEIDVDPTQFRGGCDPDIDGVDDDKLQKMSKLELIQEIITCSPSVKENDLSQRSHEELIKLFKSLG